MFVTGALGIAMLVPGCVSVPVEKSIDVKDLDTKIAEEFDAHVLENNFYDASNSFIEFSACCDGDKKDEMLRELTDLLRAEIDKKREANDRLGMITDMYSYINLVEAAGQEGRTDDLKEE